MVRAPLYEGTFEYAAAERSAYNKRFVISVGIANMQRTCNTQTATEVTPQQLPLIFANEIVPENVFAGVCAPSSAFGASSLWELHLRQQDMGSSCWGRLNCVSSFIAIETAGDGGRQVEISLDWVCEIK